MPVFSPNLTVGAVENGFTIKEVVDGPNAKYVAQEISAVDGITVGAEQSVNFTGSLSELTPVNSTAAAIIVTAPTGTSAGDVFEIVDSRATSTINNITIDFGAQNFHGSTGSFLLNDDGAAVRFIYIDATIGWAKRA